MQIAVAATPAVALPTLDWLLTSQHRLNHLITRPDRPAGRGKELRSSRVSQWGSAHSVPILKPAKIEMVADSLAEVDLLLTIGFGIILPESILSIPTHGAINLHFSLLPAWRGAAPVQRAIEHGDSEGGVSVFALDEGMDTGPIYIARRTQYSPSKSAGEILSELSILGALAVRDAIDLIASGAIPTPQPKTGASIARKISKIDARIDWSQPATHVARGIRAFTPEPGAWSIWRGNSIQFSKARFTEDAWALAPGEIALRAGRAIIGCGSGTSIEILEVTPAGKKKMDVRNWANGARIGMGERFV